MRNRTDGSLARRLFPWVVFLAILLGFVGLRLLGYGGLTATVGTRDTQTYIDTAEIPFPSLEFFTSIRSATIPLFYKILRPSGGYNMTLIAEPAWSGGADRPIVQPGFERVALAQTAIAILGWGALAFVFYRRLKHPVVRAMAAAAILAFGFVPQMADWDYVLLSESVSFSLYALLLAGVVELCFNGLRGRPVFIVLLAGLVGLWVFTRDTNVYLVLFSLAILAGLMIYRLGRAYTSRKRAAGMASPPRPQWAAGIWAALLLAGLLAGVYLFHQATFRASSRWLLPLLNNLTINVFPYPARVEFFEQRGMPATPQMLAIRGHAEYSGIFDQSKLLVWAWQDGLDTYTSFLMHTPRWAAESVISDLEFIFSENIQPYFQEKYLPEVPLEERARYAARPSGLLRLGDLLHPRSSTVLLLDVLLMLIIVGAAWQDKKSLSSAMAMRSRSDAMPWAVFAAWLVLGSLAMMTLGHLGEARSVLRHAMAGVVPLRLALWLLLAIVADFVLGGVEHEGRF